MSYLDPMDEPQEELAAVDKALRGRLYFFRLLIVVVVSLLLYRVYWLQQVQGQEFVAQSQENRTARLYTNPPRGVIFDRNGRLLAANEASFNVTITPAFLPRDEDERLAVFERLSI
ncbi:MAG: hypothetical protein KDE51_23205, partial [Anaerolineales bacterium]|nr:hypothetical protein [Anaerolineales bacterium]